MFAFDGSGWLLKAYAKLYKLQRLAQDFAIAVAIAVESLSNRLQCKLIAWHQFVAVQLITRFVAK